MKSSERTNIEYERVELEEFRLAREAFYKECAELEGISYEEWLQKEEL